MHELLTFSIIVHTEKTRVKNIPYYETKRPRIEVALLCNKKEGYVMKSGRSKLPIKFALIVLGVTIIIVVISDCVMYGVIGIFLAGLFLVLALRYTDKFLMQKKYKVIDYTYTKGLSIPTGMTLMDERGRKIHLNDYSGNLPSIGESTNIAIPYEYLDMKDIDGIKYITAVMKWKQS